MKRAVIVVVGVCVILGGLLRAQGSYEALHTFSGNQGRPVAGLVEGSGGRLYGTTESGGFHGKGSVFVTDAGGNAEILHEFSGPDGATPLGRLLVASDGNVYGTTSAGGPGGFGTVYRVSPAGDLTTVVSFDDGIQGGSPHGGLIEVGGVLYGTTLNGGTGFGTIFGLPLDGGDLSSIPFTGENGGLPAGDLFYRAADDSIYGTAQLGGATGAGAIFKLDSDRVTLTAVASFDAAVNGSAPRDGVMEASDLNLYGMTPGDGVSDFGTLFRLDTTSGELTTIVSFIGDNGALPAGGLRQFSDGKLYGTTTEGGAIGFGTVFSVSIEDAALETLYSFSNSEGASPSGGLIQTSSGAAYGTTANGGPGGLGTVFQLLPGNAPTLVLAFTGTTGAKPSGRLLEANDGNFYGTTMRGGTHGLGTVFRLTNDGLISTIASFDGAMGAVPSGGLVQGLGGDLYGTTEEGGDWDEGTAFRMTLDGTFVWSTSFDSFAEEAPSGATPVGGLTATSGGDMYGTTLFGAGLGTVGSVFRLTSAGAIQTLVTFTGDNGAFPTSGVTLDSSGALVGATEEGGEFGSGTVFRLPVGGELETVKSFDGYAEGWLPTARPLVAGDGSIYGTTQFGGDADQGVVYRIATDGSFSAISFDGANGSTPFQEGLVETRDGKLYGTASGGGNGFGVVYRLDDGAIVPIPQFDGIAGAAPNSTLIQGIDGSLYGTTDGPQGGTIFRIAFEEQAATLELAPATATYGGHAILSATLSSSSGPLAGVDVAFSLNGIPVGAAITDDGGRASLANVSVAGLDALSYAGAITASAGDAHASADLTIARAIPTVTVTGGSFAYDAAPHAASATVTGVAGEDLGPALITYNGGPGAPIEPATYAVNASYAGSANYEPASGTATLTILPPAPGVTGLVAAYGFNEGAGNVAADASGRGHAGVIRGAKYVEGRFGRALSFDGERDWVTIADAAALNLRNALTIEAGENPEKLSGWRTIVL